MKKLLILFSIMLILISCDRFEHNFEADVNQIFADEFFNGFASELTNITQVNLPVIMTFYDEAYNNNGLSKTDIEAYYQSLLDDGLILTATLTDTTALPEITWHLIGDDGTKSIVVDEEFEDVLVIVDDEYKFYGNQANMRNVVVELFTGDWCPNCPNAEEALHNLRMQYGSRISYVEYHYFDQLEGEFVEDLFNYYPNNEGLPFGIVNGNEHLLYSAPSISEVQAEIEAAIAPLLDEEPLVLLSNLQTDLTYPVLSGSLQIDIDASVATDDLKLVAVLMEDFNDEYLNSHQEPHLNIALKQITVDVSTLDLANPVNFEINDLDILPDWYMNNATGLPEDLTLVIWIQRLESTYDEGTCEIYNVIQVSL